MTENNLSSEVKDKQWKSFIKHIFKRRRADKRHKIPMDYIEALADSVHRINPTKEILINTLSGLYEVAYTKGYARRIQDAKEFRDKQERHFQDDWNKEKDAIDDLIHAKSNQTDK